MKEFVLVAMAVCAGIVLAAFVLLVSGLFLMRLLDRDKERRQARASAMVLAAFAQSSRVKELVLPSGAFAKIRTMTGADVAKVSAIAKANSDDWLLATVVTCVLVDDIPLTPELYNKMDARDILALSASLSEYLTGPIRH
jgi:hypothetical protein